MPVTHKWACSATSEPGAATTEICVPKACALQQEDHLNEKLGTTTETSPTSLQLEKVHEKQQGPSAAKKKINKFPQTERPYDLAIPLLGTYPEEKRKLQFKNKQYSQ